MDRLLLAILVAAALTFIVVSATMNALFLSSLGRTPIEAGLLAAVSLASDAAKAVLPIVLARAVALRAWAQGAAAGAMLAVVVAMSLASGTGFAAVMRSATAMQRDAQSEQLETRRRDLSDTQARLAALPRSRSSGEIEADLEAALLDPRALGTKSCVEPRGPSARAVCTEVLRLRGELATTAERARLTAERDRLREQIDVLQAAGAGQDGDAQATAIAKLLGVHRELPRTALTTALAVVLELGAVLLVMLAAGPTLRGLREVIPEPSVTAAIVPAEIPLQADRQYWRRQQSRVTLTKSERGPANDR